MRPDGEKQITALAERVVAGEQRAVSQAISLCENMAHADRTNALVAQLWPHTGHAATVGITGPPGVGKSTLTSGLIKHLREENKTVGIIAVDPSSVVSNGALLGDRIRMSDNMLDPGVFIRSMSARGHLGGISETTFLAMMVLDAAGKDVVVVETVGVGQSETEIRSLVDTVAVILQPDSGDSVQALKSGLLEIPDVLCLNKKDRPGADKAKQNLKSFLSPDDNTLPLFIETDATHDEGLDGLCSAIQLHRDILGEKGLRSQRRANLTKTVASIATTRILGPITEALKSETNEDLLDQLELRTINPLQVINHILDQSSVNLEKATRR